MAWFRPASRPTSLERQLRQQLFYGLLLLLIAVFGMLHFALQQLTIQFVTSRLAHDIDNLISAMTYTPQNDWQLDEGRLTDVYQRPYSGHYYYVRFIDSEWRSRSLWDIDLTPFVNQHPTLNGPKKRHIDGPNDQEWVTLTLPVTKDQQMFMIWMAEDIKPLQAIMFRFELAILLLFAASIPIVLLMQKTIVTRSFRVFDGIHRALIHIQKGEPPEFPEQSPAEVSELVQEIQRVLGRSAKQLQRSRTAVGNLAHELKRPLQNLRWIADQPDTQRREELLSLYHSLQTLITRELRRAAISGSPTPGKRFNPNDDLPLLHTLLRRQHAKNIDLKMTLPEGTLPYDRDDLLELLGNLIDNAWRFAQSTIVLSVEPSNTLGWAVSVEDDGPGLSTEDCEFLSQRGISRDESSDNHHGLGLHICRAVVDSYDGTMQLSRSTMGGLKIAIVLP